MENVHSSARQEMCYTYIHEVLWCSSRQKRIKQLLNNVNKNCDPHVLRQICSCNQLVIRRSVVVLTCVIHNAKYSRHIALETLDVQRRQFIQ